MDSPVNKINYNKAGGELAAAYQAYKSATPNPNFVISCRSFTAGFNAARALFEKKDVVVDL